MSKKRSYYSAKSKAKITIEAIKEKLTQAQLTSEYGVHPTQIKQWKQQGISAIESSFNKQAEKTLKAQEGLVKGLYEQIGQLHTQLDWLKKKRPQSIGEKSHD